MRKKQRNVYLIKQDGIIIPSSTLSNENIYKHFQKTYYEDYQKTNLENLLKTTKKKSLLKRIEKFFDNGGMVLVAFLIMAIIGLCMLHKAENRNKVHQSTQAGKAVRIQTQQDRYEIAIRAILMETKGIPGVYDFSDSVNNHLIVEAEFSPDCVELVKIDDKSTNTTNVEVRLNGTSSVWSSKNCFKD